MIIAGLSLRPKVSEYRNNAQVDRELTQPQCYTTNNLIMWYKI